MKAVHSILIAVMSLTAIMNITASAQAQITADDLINQATEASGNRNHDKAIRLATAAIEKDPSAATAYYVRGRERFRLGQIEDSVKDFNRYVELRPEIASKQWERGIACFYAGMYEQGAKQFESYQEFDGHDVENSVWRYLCLVPGRGVREAQATMLTIENDSRVPMMQIYDLYRGKLKPDDVLLAAQAGEPNEDVLAGRMFYANLYLGLWYEAQGDAQRAKRHIDLAADEKLKDNRRINDYMWDVARIHQRLLRGELKRPSRLKAEKK